MPRYKNILLAIVAAALLSGCSTHYASINYEEFSDFDVRTESIEAKKVGIVKGEHRGPAWEGCDYATRTAVWRLISEAKEIHANAIGDIQRRDGAGPRPRCKRHWWLIIFPPTFMTPLFLDAEVEAVAYRVVEEEISLYMIPEEPGEIVQLVQRIIDETRE